MQFSVPGMPASRWQGFTSLWLVFYASETLAVLSGETPEFRILELSCIIWDKKKLRNHKRIPESCIYRGSTYLVAWLRTAITL